MLRNNCTTRINSPFDSETHLSEPTCLSRFSVQTDQRGACGAGVHGSREPCRAQEALRRVWCAARVPVQHHSANHERPELSTQDAWRGKEFIQWTSISDLVPCFTLMEFPLFIRFHQGKFSGIRRTSRTTAPRVESFLRKKMLHRDIKPELLGLVLCSSVRATQNLRLRSSILHDIRTTRKWEGLTSVENGHPLVKRW